MTGGFAFGPARRRRGPSLTPMIDVVFLLLVFFMLAARFGPETVLRLSPGGGAEGDWRGPPRLIVVAPDGLSLNGVPVAEAGLAAALRPLLPAPDAPVLLRAGEGASLQRLLDAVAALRAAGIATPVLVE
jgi:biopolymer transport protein ExbD